MNDTLMKGVPGGSWLILLDAQQPTYTRIYDKVGGEALSKAHASDLVEAGEQGDVGHGEVGGVGVPPCAQLPVKEVEPPAVKTLQTPSSY